MYIYVDKEAYEMLREMKSRLAKKFKVSEKDVSNSMVIKHLINEYLKTQHLE